MIIGAKRKKGIDNMKLGIRIKLDDEKIVDQKVSDIKQLKNIMKDVRNKLR